MSDIKDELNQHSTPSDTYAASSETPHCSFCNKSQDAVAKLISSPSDNTRAYICDECVVTSFEILDESGWEMSNPTPEQLEKRRALRDKIRAWRESLKS